MIEFGAVITILFFTREARAPAAFLCVAPIRGSIGALRPWATSQAA